VLRQLAEKDDFREKSRLVDLQNRIVDPCFRDPGYRKDQNYVGESLTWRKEKVHFAPPKPRDLPASSRPMGAWATEAFRRSSMQPPSPTASYSCICSGIGTGASIVS